LRLRADNAETRLDTNAMEAGCLSTPRLEHRRRRLARLSAASDHLAQQTSRSSFPDTGSAGDGERRSLSEWMRFPDIARYVVASTPTRLAGAEMDELLEDALYAPYLERQAREIRRAANDRAVMLPDDIDYRTIGGLSNEMVEKLELARPETLDQATRIRGITPAALSAILVASRRCAA